MQKIDVLLVKIPLNTHYIVPPLGLGYLGSCIKNEGISVKILDAIQRRLSLSKLVKEILKINPKVLGIQVYSIDVSKVRKITKIIKTISPQMKIVLGGLIS